MVGVIFWSVITLLQLVGSFLFVWVSTRQTNELKLAVIAMAAVTFVTAVIAAQKTKERIEWYKKYK